MGRQNTGDADDLGRFQQAVEDHPEEPGNWLRYGRVLLDRGLRHEGLDALTEAYRRDPDSPCIRYRLACALAKNGRHKEAMGHFWSVCLDDPTLEHADSALGLWSLIGMA
jgi:cytochrome c-type biogenesis protein CcmH/NrfG